MSDKSEPRWDLLPHAPEEFFELPDDFDMRDLKRSYNRLIRRFKPEKFPEEFQRIRGAYESLGDALRYGISSRPTPPPNAPLEVGHQDDSPRDAGDHLQTSEPSSASPPPPAEAERPELATPSPRERIATTPSSALYDELHAKQSRTAGDYVALAFLADMVTQPAAPAAENESFAGWLLAGLADHPHDWGLTELLRDYLCQELPPAEIEQLLLRAVEALPADRFQYVTERGWDRLLREAPFEQFRNCLRKCGDRLDRSIDVTQLVFYVHILKQALWKADDEFLQHLQQTVEDHYDLLDPWVQGEFELIDSLIVYRERRDEFTSCGPCCRRIDRAIQDWCLLDETEGDRSVLGCQYYLSMRGKRILDELPDCEADFTWVLIPWELIVDDVLDRLGEPDPPPESSLEEHARDFMIRCMRRRERSPQYNRGLMIAITGFALLVVILVTSGAFVVRMFWKLLAAGQFLGALFDLLLAAATLVGGLIASLVAFVISYRTTRLRYETIRRELIKLIRVAPVPIGQLATIIEECEDEEYGDGDSIASADVVAEKLQSDAALELFSQAQICLNVADAAPVDEAELVENP